MGRLGHPISIATKPRSVGEAVPDPFRRQTHGIAAWATRDRAYLIAATAASFLVVFAVTMLTLPPVEMEPELQRLLRGMVLIKGLFGLGALSLLLWRFGGPIDRSPARGYTAGICLAFAALAWLWGLTYIPVGGFLFWCGLGGILLTARSDRRIGEMIRRRP